MAEQNSSDVSEAIKVPMRHTYKYVEKVNDDGTVTKDKTPYFPYTKTSAITNEDNINLDVMIVT